jgi:micrococcal nuclease
MARRGPALPDGLEPRRASRWGRGLPPRRPPGLLVRLLQRLFSPVFYLNVVLIVALFGLFVLPFGIDMASGALHPVTRAEGDCRIVAVIDGDTVTMACADLGVFRARLLGLDTPEKYSPRCAAELVAAEEATWALRGLLLQAGKVAVTLDGVDRYGRRLARLEVDGEDVATRMIRDGHARRYGGGLRGTWC